jgi:uncharacterized protein DUF6817
LDSGIDIVVEWLRDQGAGSIEHPGGSLLDHLVRVHAKLSAWRLDRDVCLAGLCHAAYGTDGFTRSLLTTDERPVLVELVGQRAESLAYVYASCDRDLTYPSFSSTDADVVIVDRFTGVHATPTHATVAAFCHITIANELDVLVHKDYRSTTFINWLRQISSDMAPWLNDDAIAECQLTLGGQTTDPGAFPPPEP